MRTSTGQTSPTIYALRTFVLSTLFTHRKTLTDRTSLTMDDEYGLKERVPGTAHGDAKIE